VLVFVFIDDEPNEGITECLCGRCSPIYSLESYILETGWWVNILWVKRMDHPTFLYWFYVCYYYME